MSLSAPYSAAREPMPENEQKQAALSYLNEAWADARHDGVDGDCLAQASMFAALAELVTTYGEDAVAKFAEGLASRVRNGGRSRSQAIESARRQASTGRHSARPGPVWRDDDMPRRVWHACTSATRQAACRSGFP